MKKKTIPVMFRLNESDLAEIKRIAEAERRTAASVIRQAVAELLRRKYRKL